jgi:RND family efflux transporter MFP subunit
MQSVLNILKWPFAKFSTLSKRGKVITIIVLVLLVLWRVNAYRKSGLQVEETTAHTGTLTESVNASGEVSAKKAANLAFQTAGEVKEVNFQEGDKVQKGNIIAKLDTTNLYLAYLQTDATLRAAQAALNYTYDTLQGKEHTESFSEISTRTTAETTKDRAYWAYAAAQKALEGAYIKAPFDGVVTQIPVDLSAGAYISLPTTANFQVVDPATTYFQAEISESDIHKLKISDEAKIEIDAYPDQEFTGKVETLNFSSTITSTGGTAYIAKVSLPQNNNMMFRLGMNGDVNVIISRKEDVLLVPITAVVEEQDGNYVWVDNHGKAKKVKVETGGSSVDEIEIKSGIDNGTKVVSRPPTKIKEGAKLKV